MSITFNILIKACFSNKKYIVSIQTHSTQIENDIFLVEKVVLSGFLKNISVENIS